MERPRAIVLGTGVIGRVHIDALRRNNVDIVSVVASSEARSIAAAEAFGVPRGDPDLATALGATNPDVVHICTPDAYHLKQARMALDAGVHVVCEKPLTTDAGSAGELYRRAVESGRVHAICFNNRFYTLVQELAARRRLGTLDRVMLVRGVRRGRHVLARDGLGLAPAPRNGWSHDRHVDHRQPSSRSHQLSHRQPRRSRVRRFPHGARHAQAPATRRRHRRLSRPR